MKVKEIKRGLVQNVLLPGNRIFESKVAYHPITNLKLKVDSSIYFPRNIFGNDKKKTSGKRHMNLITKRQRLIKSDEETKLCPSSHLGFALNNSTYARMVIEDLSELSKSKTFLNYVPEYQVPLVSKQWKRCCKKCGVTNESVQNKSFISLDLYMKDLKMYIELDGSSHDSLESIKEDRARKMYMEEEYGISELRLKYYASGGPMHKNPKTGNFDLIVGEKRKQALDELDRVLTQRYNVCSSFLDKIVDPHKKYNWAFLESFTINALRTGELAYKAFEYFTESDKSMMDVSRMFITGPKNRKDLFYDLKFLNRILK